jgi:multidrug efflux pump subunit AcrA (membrane-fusion protein)
MSLPRFLAALLLSLAALVPVACSKTEEAAPTEVYVQAEHPEKGEISEQITADATLAPLSQAAISPKVTAPVKKFYVQRGSHVKAGQLLATLRTRTSKPLRLTTRAPTAPPRVLTISPPGPPYPKTRSRHSWT